MGKIYVAQKTQTQKCALETEFETCMFQAIFGKSWSMQLELSE